MTRQNPGELNMDLVQQLHEHLMKTNSVYRKCEQMGWKEMMIHIQLKAVEDGWPNKKPTPPDVEWTAGELFEIAEAHERLESMTDREIAKLIENHVMPGMSVLDVKGALIEEAIERLERASGPAYPMKERCYCSDEILPKDCPKHGD